MTYTAKQEAAIKRAPKGKRAALMQSFDRAGPKGSKRFKSKKQFPGGYSRPGSGRLRSLGGWAEPGVFGHHWDSFRQMNAPRIATSVGPCSYVRSQMRNTISLIAGESTLLLINPSQTGLTQPEISPTAGIWWPSYVPTSTGLESSNSIVLPMAIGREDTVAPGRCSIRMRYTGTALNVNGVIRVLRFWGNIGMHLVENTYPDSALDILTNRIDQHPRTATHTIKSLEHAHQWDCLPINIGTYGQPNDPMVWTGSGPNSRDYFLDSLHSSATAGTPAVTVHNSMTTLAFFIPPVTEPVNLEFVVSSGYFVRGNTNASIHALYEMQHPTEPIAALNAKRDHAESSGSAGRPVNDTNPPGWMPEPGQIVSSGINILTDAPIPAGRRRR